MQKTKIKIKMKDNRVELRAKDMRSAFIAISLVITELIPICVNDIDGFFDKMKKEVKKRLNKDSKKKRGKNE